MPASAPAARASFGPRFGHDFSHVPLHSGSSSAQVLMRKPAPASQAADCSPKQQGDIGVASVKAHTWLTRTLTALDSFLAGAKTRGAQAAGAALSRHFHSTDRAVGAYVRQRLATIQGDIFGRSSLRLICPPRSNPTCALAGTDSNPIAIVLEDKPNEINLCNLFFDRGEDERASTLIHELGHAQLGLRSEQRMGDREYKDDAYYFYLSTGAALTNAESYAMFARQVATGSSPARGGITDWVSDCPSSWIPPIADAMTRARTWNHEAAKHTIDPCTKVRNRYARAFLATDAKLKESQSFTCVPDGSGRCSSRTVAYWYIAGNLRICPALIAQRNPEDRALSMLASLYAYDALVDSSESIQAAKEARRLHNCYVPSTAAVLRKST